MPKGAKNDWAQEPISRDMGMRMCTWGFLPAKIHLEARRGVSRPPGFEKGLAVVERSERAIFPRRPLPADESTRNSAG